jgi:membrane associated rhomboid family serine protease
VRREAIRLLLPDRNVGEQSVGFAALARIDLPTALAWYRSRPADRFRRRMHLFAEHSVLCAAGQVEAYLGRVTSHPLSPLDRAARLAMVSIAAGTPADEALAPLAEHGAPGQIARDRIERLHIVPQALTDDDRAYVDGLVAGDQTYRTILSRDTGTWRPILTWVVGAALVVAYLRELAAGPFTTAQLYRDGAFVTGTGLEWWRALTAPYLHASAAHLLFNLVGLLGVGRLCEARLARWQYVVTWFATSSGAFVLVGLLQHDPGIDVGASGGVLGLLGAGFAVLAVQRLRHPSPALTASLRLIGAIVALQLVIDHLVPDVAWLGHLAGLLVGMLLGVTFELFRRVG